MPRYDSSVKEFLAHVVEACKAQPDATLEVLADDLIAEHGYFRLRDDDWYALFKETVRRDRGLSWEKGQELVVASGFTITHDVPHGERVAVLEAPEVFENQRPERRMYVVRYDGARQFLTEEELEFPFADLMGVMVR